MSLFEQKVNA